MPLYEVLGLNRSDQEATIRVSADDESGAREVATRKGVQAISITMLRADKAGSAIRVKKKLSPKQVWYFCERLAPLQEQEIPAAQSMEFMSGRTPDPILRAVALDIKEKLASASLVDAICATGRFPSMVEGCLKAGGTTAEVDKILKMLSRFYEMRVEMVSTIRTAMIQPGLSLILIFFFVMFCLLYIAPKMGDVLATMGYEPGFLLRTQLSIAYVIKTFWPISLLAFAGAIAFFVVRSKHRQNFFEWTIQHVTPLREVVYGMRQTALAYCMSTLTGAGLPYARCFPFMVDVMRDTPLEKQLQDAAKNYEETGVFSDSLQRYVPMLDPEIIFQIRVGEKTATLPEQLQRVAEIYEKRTASGARSLAAKLTPIILIVGAVAAGSSYLLPFFSLMSVCFKLMRGGN